MSGKFTCWIAQIGLILLISCGITAAQKTRKKTPKKPVPTSVGVYTAIGSMRVNPVPLSEAELINSYIFSASKSVRLIADSDRAAKDRAEAEIVRLSKLINENPLLWARAYVMRAENRLKLGRYDEAIADYTEALGFAEYDSLNYRAIARAKKGDYETAISEFTKTLEFIAEKSEDIKFLNLNLDADAVQYNRGLARFNKGDFESAIADLTAYLKANPKQIKAFQLRSKAFRKLGKIPEAEADERLIEELQKNG